MTDKKSAADAQAPVSPLTARRTSFAQVEIRLKNWNGDELILPFNSYTAVASATATTKFKTLCPEVKAGSPAPDFLSVYELLDGTTDIAGIPTIIKDDSTIPISWPKDGRLHVDLKLWLMTHRFPIPDDHRAHIPVVIQEIEGAGKSFVIHFSKAWTEPIEERKNKKNNTTTQPATQPQTQPEAKAQ